MNRRDVIGWERIRAAETPEGRELNAAQRELASCDPRPLSRRHIERILARALRSNAAARTPRRVAVLAAAAAVLLSGLLSLGWIGQGTIVAKQPATISRFHGDGALSNAIAIVESLTTSIDERVAALASLNLYCLSGAGILAKACTSDDEAIATTARTLRDRLLRQLGGQDTTASSAAHPGIAPEVDGLQLDSRAVSLDTRSLRSLADAMSEAIRVAEEALPWDGASAQKKAMRARKLLARLAVAEQH